MRVHPCDAVGQKAHSPFEFKAHLYSEKEVVVEVPVLDYTDMGKDDEHVREIFEYEDENGGGVTMDKEDEVLMEALDVGRNKLADRIDNKVFPIKKQYRIKFSGDVKLNSEVLKAHQDSKDTSQLFLRPLPIDYSVDVLQNAYENDLTWAELPLRIVNLARSESDLTQEQRNTHFLHLKMLAIQRLCIELADMNKEHRKRGKIVKPANVSSATAMLSAMSIGKKKKKTS